VIIDGQQLLHYFTETVLTEMPDYEIQTFWCLILLTVLSLATLATITVILGLFFLVIKTNGFPDQFQVQRRKTLQRRRRRTSRRLRSIQSLCRYYSDEKQLVWGPRVGGLGHVSSNVDLNGDSWQADKAVGTRDSTSDVNTSGRCLVPLSIIKISDSHCESDNKADSNSTAGDPISPRHSSGKPDYMGELAKLGISGQSFISLITIYSDGTKEYEFIDDGDGQQK